MHCFVCGGSRRNGLSGAGAGIIVGAAAWSRQRWQRQMTTTLFSRGGLLRRWRRLVLRGLVLRLARAVLPGGRLASRFAADPERRKGLLIGHAGLLQALLRLELVQCALGLRTDLPVRAPHVEALLVER